MRRYESTAGRDIDQAGTSHPARPFAPARPSGVPAAFLTLQRSAGNAAVVAFLQTSRAEEPVEEPTVQRSGVLDVLPSPGRPLDTPVRRDMEARLGADFRSVRIHTGPAAGRSAAAIGAQAYTSGEHVVLGPGAGDRHTLAHELTHVIQQRRGPVAGTVRGDGLRISDPSDHDERAAEANAHRALRHPPTELGQNAPEPPHARSGPAPGRLTVQRKVGIEIETGWYVDTADKPLIGKTKPGKPLKKYDVVGDPFDGFKVTADTAPNKRSEIEFVVDPPVEEGDEGKQRLDTVMKNLTDVGKGMEQAAQGTEHFTQDKATNRKPDKNFVITPRGRLDGSPQVTLGLALGAITRMAPPPPPAPAAGQQPAPQPPQDRPAPTPMQPGTSYLAGQARRVTGKGAIPTPSDDLRGLIAVISSYIIKGSVTAQQLAYPKQIANVLMARTDFAKLFQLLPAAERTILEADKQLWVDLVVDAATAGKFSGGAIDPDKNVIEAGTKRTGVRDLTIKDWLTAIAENDDKLNSVFAPTNMGALKDRTEQVGPDNARQEAGIFEFRASQMTKLPLDKWKEFALMAHDYITRLHGG
ncbi:DUF4157 domain-containing protein [Pseudonocardia alaniniphila]|uniref:DUF4157 domain-containing protein n=1 Tax=Pseudonocardia alaniniphila TaxID=75291 RepID=A0ABS9TGQ5_9PSEU|nr:DUF4157 domain-containing protein [Pseudonocardia alaniniphila]MCH6167727.1 DUF4157 domain-containing protein [Pseudonocardia alaniniphila]